MADSSAIQELVPKCEGLEKFYPCFEPAIRAQKDYITAMRTVYQGGEKLVATCKNIQPDTQDNAQLAALANYQKGYASLQATANKANRAAVEQWNSCVMPIRTNLGKACNADFEAVMKRESGETTRNLSQEHANPRCFDAAGPIAPRSGRANKQSNGLKNLNFQGAYR